MKKPKRKKSEPSVVWRKLEEIENRLDIIVEQMAALLAIREARRRLAAIGDTARRKKQEKGPRRKRG